ncbi:MAG: hypothetical protein LBF59_08255 [Prevotellaceae bacterium]|nr:hypothetical protein [Prevotellaceae bacterium]
MKNFSTESCFGIFHFHRSRKREAVALVSRVNTACFDIASGIERYGNPQSV